MAEEARAPRGECAIERDHEDWPDQAVVLDGYATKVFGVPKSWRDEDIWLVLRIFNSAFAEGHTKGELSKAAEVRKSIGAKPEFRVIGEERVLSDQKNSAKYE